MVLSLELKYKTSSLKSLEKGETFDLQNHSAQDIGRYDFVKDLWRLENIVANSEHVIGYAVMLTNDPSYWIQSRNALTVDRDFRLHEGRELHGTLH